MSKLYYTPPSDEIFNQVKSACMELWKEVDTDGDKFGYASSKINSIKDIQNVGDNFMYMIAMFDHLNHRKLTNKLSDEARKEIRDRMVDGGNLSYLIPF